MENSTQPRKLKWILLVVIFVILVIGALIGGYFWGLNVGKKKAVVTGGTPVINPFEAVKTNPLEGQGYTNPFEEVKTNPFK